MNNLAELYRRENKSRQAEELLTNILEVRRRVQGASHHNTMDALAALGAIKLEQSKYDDATPLLREALDAYTRAGAASWRRYFTENLLGSSLAAQGKYEKAERPLISGWQGLIERKQTIPSETQSVLTQAGENIVHLYLDWGEPEKAAKWQRQIQEVMTAARSSQKH